MASMTVAIYPCWFCQAIRSNNVFNCGRCPLKVAENDTNDLYNHCKNSWGIEKHSCHIWVTQTAGYHNSPQFIADRVFMWNNDINHIKSGPYHPATNGLVKCFVQPLRQAIWAALTEKKTIPWKLANFLLAKRMTPHTMTREMPSVLLMGRNIRTNVRCS